MVQDSERESFFMENDFISVRSSRQPSAPSKVYDGGEGKDIGSFEPDSFAQLSDIEPVDGSGESVILEAMNIGDNLAFLPPEDRDNLREFDSYIRSTMESKGISPTKGAYNRIVEKTMNKLELDPDTDPSFALDKIAGLVRMWRALSFVKSSKRKEKIFQKALKSDGSKKMERLLMDEMENSEVWQ